MHLRNFMPAKTPAPEKDCGPKVMVLRGEEANQRNATKRSDHSPFFAGYTSPAAAGGGSALSSHAPAKQPHLLET
jgi:hypothetical protein